MRRHVRGAKGATFIEAALITPLLLLLTFGIVEFSALFYVYLALENGVSQAARYGVTGNAIANTSREDSIKTAMRSATPTITLPDSAFTFSNLPEGAGTWVPGAGGPGDLEKVTVDYTWAIMTPILRPFFTNGQIHFTVAATMKNEGRFQ
jgi:Flp pilus assembly protein TadG